MQRAWRALHVMVLTPLVLAALGGCGPAVSVRTAQDPSAVLTSYRSFAMLEPNKPVPSESTDVDPFVLQRLRQLAYLKLKDMGYVPAERTEADLLVGVMAARDRRYYTYTTRAYPYDPYFMGPGWSTAVDTIEEGTIVVDLIDRAKKSVVWRGTGVRTLDRNMTDPELKETVDTILDHFPSVTAPHEPSSTP